MKQANKLFLILFVLSYIIFYIWVRFLRERLPRYIPFNLTIFSFLSLSIICFIYFYVLFRMLKPYKTSKFTQYLTHIVESVMQGLLDLCQEIITKTFIAPYYQQFFIAVLHHFEKVITKPLHYYFMIICLPKIILLTVFWIDVFYFHKIHYFYFVIFLGIITLFNALFLFFLKMLKELLITKLSLFLFNGNILLDLSPYTYNLYETVFNTELTEDILEEHRGYNTLPEIFEVPLQVFINHFSLENEYPYNLIKNNYTYTFVGNANYKEYFCKQQNILTETMTYTKDYFSACQKDCDYLLSQILLVEFCLYHYYIFDNVSSKFKFFKILIHINYLICWLYILVISLPYLTLHEYFILLALYNANKFIIFSTLYSIITSKYIIMVAVSLCCLYSNKRQ